MMFKKICLVAAVLAVLAVLVSITPLTAAAAGPTNIDLQHAMPISNQSINLPAYGVLWYSFRYPGGSVGNKPTVTVTLLNGNNSNLKFMVWTPEQAADMTNEVAIGQGTPAKLNCNLYNCPSPDLVYQGEFYTAGIYYVEVFNSNPYPVTATLTVQGDGVTSR